MEFNFISLFVELRAVLPYIFFQNCYILLLSEYISFPDVQARWRISDTLYCQYLYTALSPRGHSGQMYIEKSRLQDEGHRVL